MSDLRLKTNATVSAVAAAVQHDARRGEPVDRFCQNRLSVLTEIPPFRGWFRIAFAPMITILIIGEGTTAVQIDAPKLRLDLWEKMG